MANWPDNYEGAWTLADSFSLRGVGLHSGEINRIRLLPSEKKGIQLSWLDCNDPPITLNPHQVRDSPLCTTLELGSRRLATVEHMLAAIAGCGLTHIEIQVEGTEVPLLDGSAINWVEAIAEVGIRPAATEAAARLSLDAPLVLNRGKSVIAATPADNFGLVGLIDFPQDAIGKQFLAVDLTPEKFVNEIAPARTFGFRDQVDQLRKAGLIKGGALENALVCDGDKWINPPLRFKDEPVRHKMLDLIGDLALVGFPRAQVLVYKGSHGLHNDFACALFKASSSYC